jgi:endonuclease YncB( thermonuclease family)
MSNWTVTASTATATLEAQIYAKELAEARNSRSNLWGGPNNAIQVEKVKTRVRHQHTLVQTYRGGIDGSAPVSISL